MFHKIHPIENIQNKPKKLTWNISFENLKKIIKSTFTISKSQNNLCAFTKKSSIHSVKYCMLQVAQLQEVSEPIKEYMDSNKHSYSFHCKNMNPELAKICGIKSWKLPNYKSNNWIAPEFHGLDNSNRIIPEYYFTNHDYKKIFDFDYFNMILDDIKNLRPLSEHQMEYIKGISDEKKNANYRNFT